MKESEHGAAVRLLLAAPGLVCAWRDVCVRRSLLPNRAARTAAALDGIGTIAEARRTGYPHPSCPAAPSSGDNNQRGQRLPEVACVAAPLPLTLRTLSLQGPAGATASLGWGGAMNTATICNRAERALPTATVGSPPGRRRGVLASVLVLAACIFVAPAIAQVLPQPKKSLGAGKSLDERLTTVEDDLRLTDLEVKVLKDSLDARIAAVYRVLDCNNSDYTTLQAGSHGLAFFISCERIEPYLEGHRILLRVGNPYSMAFRGLSARLGFGKSVSNPLMNSEEVDISTSDVLKPGAWVDVAVILNPSKAEALRLLYVRLLTFKAVLGRGSLR